MPGHLLDNLLLFGRVLRGLGLDVNPGRMLDLASALSLVSIGNRQDFYYTSRSLLVHDVDDLELFDQAFALFWRVAPEGWQVRSPAPPSRRHPQRVPPLLQAPPPADGQGAAADPLLVEVTMTYSAWEALRHKDFADLSEEEIEAVRRLIASLNWRLGERRTRRFRPGSGPALDLRRAIRHNLRHGGEILYWPRRVHPFKPRPLVVLADISGSMERYSRLLLHFVYGLTLGLGRPVESFVFGTRLTRITKQLQHKRIDRALREVAATVNDWSGGTRIGESLRRFNVEWGRRVVGRGAVVLLISDGWDRGDPALLTTEMARLQRSAHRLIWLNPLLGSPEYEPLTRGMQAALPYVDDFLPVHNVKSLEALGNVLSRIE